MQAKLKSFVLSHHVAVTFALLSFVALLARTFYSEFSHIFFWDEFVYHQTASDILHGNWRASDERIPGWSILIAGFNFLFMQDNHAGIILNCILGSLSVGVNYLIAQRFQIPWWGLLLHAWLWIFSWEHVLWSQAAETNISSLFFVSLFYLWLFKFLQAPRFALSFASVSFATLAGLMRIENFLLLPVVLAAFIYKRRELSLSKTWPLLGIPLLFSFPIYRSLVYYFATNWTEAGTRAQESQSNFSFHNLIDNFGEFGLGFVDLPAVMWIPIILGAIRSFKLHRGFFCFMMTSVVLYILVFYTAWLKFIGPEKVFIVFLPAVFLFVSSGYVAIEEFLKSKGPKRGNYLSKVLAIALCAAFVYEYISIEKSKDDEKVLMTQMMPSLKADLPSNSVLHTRMWTVQSFLDGVRVESMNSLYEALKNETSEHRHFYLEDISCSPEKEWISHPFLSACEKDKTEMDLKVFKTYKYGKATFQLYEVF